MTDDEFKAILNVFGLLAIGLLCALILVFLVEI